MEIINDFGIEQNEPTVVALGNFDGIHLGHKKLIDYVVEYSNKNGLKSCVFSLNPHPEVFFGRNENFVNILSSKEKAHILEKLNVDLFVDYPFNEDVAKLKPIEFIDLVISKIKCKVIVIGNDYRFGANRSGDISLLREECKKLGVEVVVIPNVMLYNERVSSSRIRDALVTKDFRLVKALLGRDYFLIGEVVKGNQIGRTIGFPTANLEARDNKLLLSDGVYATKTFYNQMFYDSITNIGTNPTVKSTDKRTVETFIFDFNEDIYHKEIMVVFLNHIRNVKKFSGIDELKAQISKDIMCAKAIFQTV